MYLADGSVGVYGKVEVVEVGKGEANAIHTVVFIPHGHRRDVFRVDDFPWSFPSPEVLGDESHNEHSRDGYKAGVGVRGKEASVNRGSLGGNGSTRVLGVYVAMEI